MYLRNHLALDHACGMVVLESQGPAGTTRTMPSPHLQFAEYLQEK